MAFETDFTSYCKRIKEIKPIIHHITNTVTKLDCANITLAIGASPIMADTPEEVEEVTAFSKALVLNIGTPTHATLEAMLRASKVANKQNVPIIFDPVGVGATKLRHHMATKLLYERNVSIIRGNASEIKGLAGIENNSRGVDAGDRVSDVETIAKGLAKEFDAVVAVTGSADIITDGRTVIDIHRGHPLLSRVTGTGCMTNSLIASFAATLGEDYLGSAAMGILIMTIAGENAAALLNKEEGIGTFRTRLFDQVDLISRNTNIGGIVSEGISFKTS